MSQPEKKQIFFRKHPKLTALIIALGIAYEAKNMDLNTIDLGLNETLSSGNANMSALIGDHHMIVIGPDAKDPALRGVLQDTGAYGETNPRLPLLAIDGSYLKPGHKYYSGHPLQINGAVSGVMIMAQQRIIANDVTNGDLRVVGDVPTTEQPSLLVNGVATTSTLSTTKGEISVRVNHGSNFHPNSSLLSGLKSLLPDWHLPKFDAQPQYTTNYEGGSTTVNVQNSTFTEDDDMEVDTGSETVVMGSGGMVVQSEGQTITMGAGGIRIENHAAHPHTHSGSIRTIVTRGANNRYVESVVGP